MPTSDLHAQLMPERNVQISSSANFMWLSQAYNRVFMTPVALTFILLVSLIHLRSQTEGLGFPWITRALTILRFTSSSAWVALKGVLPRCVRGFAAFNFWPLVVMNGLVCSSPEAAWCSDSLLLAEVVRPWLLQVSAKRSMVHCISSLGWHIERGRLHRMVLVWHQLVLLSLPAVSLDWETRHRSNYGIHLGIVVCVGQHGGKGSWWEGEGELSYSFASLRLWHLKYQH